MNVLQTAHLQTTSDLSQLAIVLAWFDQLYHDSIPKPAWFQCQLMLAEGFTNAARHAHKLLPSSTPIDINVQRFNASIEIQIWDRGIAFDLNQAIAQLPPDISANAEGGRGLMLMHRLADRLHYSRIHDRNCLNLTKRFTPAPSSEQIEPAT